MYYNEFPIKAIFFTKNRLVGEKMFQNNISFGEIKKYYEEHLSDGTTSLFNTYFLNSTKLDNSDIISNNFQKDQNSNLIDISIAIELMENNQKKTNLIHFDDEKEQINLKIIQPKLHPFGLVVFFPKNNKIQIEEYPSEIVEKFGFNTLNTNYIYCNSPYALFLSGPGGENSDFWIINHKNYGIKRKKLPINKKNFSMKYVPNVGTGLGAVFIVGGDTVETIFYDIKTEEFYRWGNMLSVHPEPALLVYNDYLYCFNSLNENNVFFEKTYLGRYTQKLWEKVFPRFKGIEPRELYNNNFAVSKSTSGNILLVGGKYANKQTYIFNTLNSTISKTNGNNETVDFREKSFYKLNKCINVAIPTNFIQNQELILLNKKEYSLKKLRYKTGKKDSIGSIVSFLESFDDANQKGSISLQGRFSPLNNQNNPNYFIYRTIGNPIFAQINKWMQNKRHQSYDYRNYMIDLNINKGNIFHNNRSNNKSMDQYQYELMEQKRILQDQQRNKRLAESKNINDKENKKIENLKLKINENSYNINDINANINLNVNEKNIKLQENGTIVTQQQDTNININIDNNNKENNILDNQQQNINENINKDNKDKDNINENINENNNENINEKNNENVNEQSKPKDNVFSGDKPQEANVNINNENEKKEEDDQKKIEENIVNNINSVEIENKENKENNNKIEDEKKDEEKELENKEDKDSKRENANLNVENERENIKQKLLERERERKKKKKKMFKSFNTFNLTNYMVFDTYNNNKIYNSQLEMNNRHNSVYERSKTKFHNKDFEAPYEEQNQNNNDKDKENIGEFKNLSDGEKDENIRKKKISKKKDEGEEQTKKKQTSNEKNEDVVKNEIIENNEQNEEIEENDGDKEEEIKNVEENQQSQEPNIEQEGDQNEEKNVEQNVEQNDEQNEEQNDEQNEEQNDEQNDEQNEEQNVEKNDALYEEQIEEQIEEENEDLNQEQNEEQGVGQNEELNEEQNMEQEGEQYEENNSEKNLDQGIQENEEEQQHIEEVKEEDNNEEQNEEQNGEQYQEGGEHQNNEQQEAEEVNHIVNEEDNQNIAQNQENFEKQQNMKINNNEENVEKAQK